MKPIEPGCLAWWRGGFDPASGRGFAGCEVRVVAREGMSASRCASCNSRQNFWEVNGLPAGEHGTCECLLTRIDGHDPEAEPEEIELPVVLGVR